MIKTHNNTFHYPAGTVISIDCGLYRHVGMMAGTTPSGVRLVMAFSAKFNGFIEHSVEEFAEGRQICIDGYFGQLTSSEVMLRARQWQNLPYSLLERNCEHFVRHAHGVAIHSPQLQGAGVAIILWTLFRPTQSQMI